MLMTTGDERNQSFVTHEELDREVRDMKKDLISAVNKMESKLIDAFKILDERALTKADFYEYMSDWHREKLRNGNKYKANGLYPSQQLFDYDMRQTLIKLLVGALIALSGVGAGIAAGLRIFQ